LKLLLVPVRPDAYEFTSDERHLSSDMLQQIRLAGLCQSDALAVGHHVQTCARCRDRIRGALARLAPQYTAQADPPHRLFVVREG
jgi:hypothetical protein